MGYKVKNRKGVYIDFDVARKHMDPEIVKDITVLCFFSPWSPEFEQEFFNVYENEHMKKFGTEWKFSRSF